METTLVLSVVTFACVLVAGEMSAVYITTSNQQSNCGSWNLYTDEKCLLVADTATLQAKQEGEAVCAMFAETEILDDIPRLVTVQNEKEQKALYQYLFEELALLDHVWLGVDRSDDGVFSWNNGSQLYFNNLAEQNITGTDRQCVQMESGQGVYPMGQWVRVNCRKRNIVVCEKTNVWLGAKLQQTFLNFKSKVERRVEKLETKQGNDVETKILQKTTGTKAPSRCGDWKQYKNEKCFKVATHAGHQTKEEAETVCQSLSEGLNQDSQARLIIVKTQEDQAFLEHFLFTESKIVDKVWLGLHKKGNSTEFQWNDGTNLEYSNWANQSTVDDRHQCVQMASGEEFYATGLWVRVNCQKAGIVVCERTQSWSLEVLKHMFLDYKFEQDKKFKQEISSLQLRNEASEKEIILLKQHNQTPQKEIILLKKKNQESQKEIILLKQNNEAAQKEINNMKQNPVPIGFVYVQLPGREPPTILWPQTSWKDVGSDYAGLFFRVEGGDAAPFGQLQDDNTRRLAAVDNVWWTESVHPLVIPSDGSWSKHVWTGTNTTVTNTKHVALKFRLTKGEVRPRNKSVKVWQRVK